MANTQQQYWSSGTEAQPVPLKIEKPSLFFECCHIRYEYERNGATSVQWQELAEQFQKAKGKRHSYLAEWCRARAGRVQ